MKPMDFWPDHLAEWTCLLLKWGEEGNEEDMKLWFSIFEKSISYVLEYQVGIWISKSVD